MTTVESTGTGLAEATRKMAAVREEIRVEKARHEREAASLDAALATATRHRDLVLAGARLDVVAIAEEFLEVKGRENVGRGEGRSVVLAAIADLSTGAKSLQHGYMGTKVYDRWDGQKEGGSYGSSPSYGTTIFYVGLRQPWRAWGEWDNEQRCRVEHAAEPLTEAQIDAGIAYLHAILGGQR